MLTPEKPMCRLVWACWPKPENPLSTCRISQIILLMLWLMKPKERLHWIQHGRFHSKSRLDGDVPFTLQMEAPEEGKSFVLKGQTRPRIPATLISSLRTFLGTLAVKDRMWVFAQTILVWPTSITFCLAILSCWTCFFNKKSGTGRQAHMPYLHEIIYVQCALQVTICALQVIFKLLPTEHTHHGKKISSHNKPVFTCMCVVSCIWLFSTPWSVARQAPLSTEFPRQEYHSRLPFPPPGDLHSTRIQQVSPATQAMAGRIFTTAPPGKPYIHV